MNVIFYCFLKLNFPPPPLPLLSLKFLRFTKETWLFLFIFFNRFSEKIKPLQKTIIIIIIIILRFNNNLSIIIILSYLNLLQSIWL